ncbi:hypothetical protein [Brevibacterium otitidis]|uniref:Phage tail tube protein n=1 Tax=Brevibacterium otitidis TaxID=53364 RepID=A0ABV5X022_9MICO|nr:hypothetical protein GCM10023233_25910 [Brevibacterium otitidis]
MAVKADQLGPGILKFGTTGSEGEFSSQVTKVELAPEFDQDDNIPVLSGEEVAGDSTESYTLTGEFLQDYSGMTSLLVWCKKHAGKQMKFEYVPSKSGGLKITGECVIRPVKIGGDVKKRNTTEFEFKGVGDWTPAAYTGDSKPE